MTALKSFATRHPVLFGCLAVLAFVVVAGVLAYTAPGDVGSEIIAAAVKVAGAFAFFHLLRRMGWLRELAAVTAAWLDLNVLHPTPVLGKRLPIL